MNKNLVLNYKTVIAEESLEFGFKYCASLYRMKNYGNPTAV